jgi:AcrR family transcriptional regulator
MPATPRTPRDRWIAVGLDALAEAGPEAVRVETLAATLGVTKGGFYGHFANRDALLSALLDEWERRATDGVLAQVEAEGGEATVRMRRAGALTFSEEILPIDLAVRSWARRDATVAERLRRVDNIRIDYLRSMFGTYLTDPLEIEARSTLAFAAAIGVDLMAADHGAYSQADVLERASSFVVGDPAAEQQAASGPLAR